MTAQAPLGVFDSGLGGLTVVRALLEQLPDESLVYLGDTARVPYGTKSGDTVIRYARQIAAFLCQFQIKHLIIACNTASAHALDVLRAELDIPVTGVVQPGAQAACEASMDKKIGVIGTLGTINSGAYQRAIHDLAAEALVFGQPCPLLVPLADEGWQDHPVSATVARHYLAELHSQCADLDTLVLACTHYPLLHETIRAEAATVFGRELTLVDSARALSSVVAQQLSSSGTQAAAGTQPELKFCFTDDSRFDLVGRRFLGRPLPGAQVVDLG